MAEAAGAQQARQQQQQQAVVVPQLYYSIDVECVAVGTDHNSRAVAQIALVDQYEQVRRSCLIPSRAPPLHTSRSSRLHTSRRAHRTPRAHRLSALLQHPSSLVPRPSPPPPTPLISGLDHPPTRSSSTCT